MPDNPYHGPPDRQILDDGRVLCPRCKRYGYDTVRGQCPICLYRASAEDFQVRTVTLPSAAGQAAEEQLKEARQLIEVQARVIESDARSADRLIAQLKERNQILEQLLEEYRTSCALKDQRITEMSDLIKQCDDIYPGCEFHSCDACHKLQEMVGE